MQDKVRVEYAVLPDWAPDECPPNVVKLIEDEQYLQDLGLRGLASADSAELHQAVRNLRRQLGYAFQAGLRARGTWKYGRLYLVAGYVLGAASVGVLAVVFGA